MSNYVVSFAVLSLILSFHACVALAGVVAWPDLPQKAFIKGRPAILGDVQNGHAVFVLQSEGVKIGLPINIKIPQYGWYFDPQAGHRLPVIIIQAERGQGMQFAGIRIIDAKGKTTKKMIVLLKEIELLGKKKPAIK